MKASFRWLSALVPSIKISPQELAERFTHAGLEVEALAEYGAGTAPIVVAEVRKIEPHPKREKLRLVTVGTGSGEQRVVCGAPNVPDPGGLVVLAPLGATLPAVGLTLTAREIGGVVSEGMLCSERELGLSSAAEKQGDDPGILVLSSGFAKPGTPLREALPAVHDWILDINVTANRPDALGHIGLAREAAALLRAHPGEGEKSSAAAAFAPPSPDAPARVSQGAIDKHVTVTIEDTERCPRFGAAMVVDVKVGPSPLWLRYRLESLGVRSISNVVDITNLIMLEFGHPMHAFDLDLVRGSKIIVRRAREGEKMVTLDGVTRTLTGDDLVIADGEGPVGLAGVMGGENSEIRAETRRVLLECAYFNARGIRRTSRRHGLHTDASHRFERGVDPADIPDVLAHAASLLTALAGGSAMPGSILAGVPLEAPRSFPLRGRRMRELLGVPVPFSEAARILGSLGFVVRGRSGGEGDDAAADVEVPTYRPDVFGEADLIEEVVRVRGLGTVPTILPAMRPAPQRSALVFEDAVRRAAIEVGLSETITYGFVSPKELASLGVAPAHTRIVNPLTEERSVMRTSLLPGLFDVLRRARRRGVHDVRVFTVGARFLAPDPNLQASAVIDKALGHPSVLLPDEAPSFAAVLAGQRRAVLEKASEIDVYDAKGVVVEIVERVSRQKVSVASQPADSRAPYLHPRGAGDVRIGESLVGSFGLIHPDVVEAFDLGGGCVVLELDLRALERAGVRVPSYQPIPMLPAASRDLAVMVREDVTAGAIEEAIREAGKELCESVELFDLFTGGHVPAGQRSLAFHVVYRDPKAATEPEAARTLTDQEVDERHKSVVETVKARFGAALRE